MSMDFNIAARRSAVPPPPVCGAGEASAPDAARLLAGAGVTLAPGAPGDVEDVGPAVEAALTRDDALGRLMDAAFSLPPPALPKFEE